MKLHYLLLCVCLVAGAEVKESKKKAKCKTSAICGMLTLLQEGQEAVVEKQNEQIAEERESQDSIVTMLSKMQAQINSIKAALYEKPTAECSDISVSPKVNGTYSIYPYRSFRDPKTVYCEFDTEGNGWTVIQRRMDGSVNFYRGWADYKTGFGSADGEYWIGNDVIHELTSHGKHELLIVMSDFENVTKYARYSTFSTGDEASGYKLSVGGYSGTSGDSFTSHNGYRFSTFDKDLDVWNKNCAQTFEGAWWYLACHYSNLNGRYLNGSHKSYANGVNWYAWHKHHYSLKATTMMIRKV